MGVAPATKGNRQVNRRKERHRATIRCIIGGVGQCTLSFYEISIVKYVGAQRNFYWSLIGQVSDLISDVWQYFPHVEIASKPEVDSNSIQKTISSIAIMELEHI